MISVVVAYHNKEAFVDETLQSLALQTFDDFEVVVIDDCSNSTSRAALHRAIRRRPSLAPFTRLVSNPSTSGPSGAAAANNVGVRHHRIYFNMLRVTYCDSLYTH